MNQVTRKDTIASVAVLATILVSAICGMFAIDVQATSEVEARRTSPPVCAANLSVAFRGLTDRTIEL